MVKCFTRKEAAVNGSVAKGRKKRKITMTENGTTMNQKANGQPNGHRETGDENMTTPTEAVTSPPNGDIAIAEGVKPVSIISIQKNRTFDMPTNGQLKRASATNGHVFAIPNGKAGHGSVSTDHPSDQDEQDAEDSIIPAVVRSSDLHGAWISIMAASDDGQWLAICDTCGQTSVYNLDTLQVRSESTVSVISLIPYSFMLLFLPSGHHLPPFSSHLHTRLS